MIHVLGPKFLLLEHRESNNLNADLSVQCTAVLLQLHNVRRKVLLVSVDV